VLLATQGLILILLTISSTANLGVMVDARSPLYDWRTDQWGAIVLAWAFIITPVLVGIWLTWGLAHLPRWRAFLLWAAWIPMLSVIAWIVSIDVEFLRTVWIHSVRHAVERSWPWPASVTWETLGCHAITILVAIVAGGPLGLAFRRLAGANRQLRRRLLRKRLRRGRAR